MSNPNNYTIGWVCALPTEYVAAQVLLDEQHEPAEPISPGDFHDYTLGRMAGHNVVIAGLAHGEYGTASVAYVAMNMIRNFPNINISLLVGIGGGVPSTKHDIRLGDIVVGTSGVLQFDFGIATQNQGFVHTKSLEEAPTVLRRAVEAFKALNERRGHRLQRAIETLYKKSLVLRQMYARPHSNTDKLFKSEATHLSSCTDLCNYNPENLIERPERAEHEDNPTIHYGLIASANQILKDALIRDRLAAEMDVLCFEMGAAGLTDFPCLVIRGICDYSDSHKNQEWQGYAAIAAAAYAKELLSSIPPTNFVTVIKIGRQEFSQDLHENEEWDAESIVSDASSVFSRAPSINSNSSLGTVHQTATHYIGCLFTEDAELLSLYNTALTKLSPERFMRNHNRLLKRYFIDLGTEIHDDLQRESVRFLRRSAQRKQITDIILNTLTTSRKGLKLNQEEPNRKLILERFLQMQEPTPIANYSSKDADNGSDTSSTDSDEAPDLDDSEGNNLSAIVDFLIKGVSFDNFKKNIRQFINPPNNIQEALSYNDAELVKDVLAKNIDQLVDDEYSWVHELIEIGCSLDEIAELLLEKHNDAPWIYFERDEVKGPGVVPGLHLDECVHSGGRDLTVTPALIGSVPESHVHSNLSEPIDGDIVKLRVQQLCGLAGVAPNSRNQKEWNGSVFFEDQNSTAFVTYDLNEAETDAQTPLLLSRVYNALQGFCKAFGQVQGAGLCCDCFTILQKDAPYAVKMHKVEVKLAVKLHEELKRLESLSKVSLDDLANCDMVALEILNDLSDNSWPMDPNRQGTMADTLNLCSFAVQVLCLGYYSYCQAHIGDIQPFFLDTPLRKIVLLGSQKYMESTSSITVELVDLACMGDMLQSPVIAFSSNKRAFQVPRDWRYDLLASPEDLMDTWGPGNFLVHPSTENKEAELCAISIGGGYIVAVDEEARRFHWSRDTELLKSLMKAFSMRAKILIGSTIIVNDTCHSDESQRWLSSNEFLENLGTFGHSWESTQRQASIQGGQYLNVQFNQTWNKFPGKPLKQVQLSLPDNHLLPFLQSSWGLQVSFCTGVGRRVPLRELIADVMPAFVETLFPIPQQWECLKVKHKIIDAFRSDALQIWLSQLPRECQELVARIVRHILSVLQYTGIDKRGENLVVAWIQRNKPFQCFKIPCERESYWARILMDSEDCATFAYITPKCLETNALKCRGPAAVWQNASALLETAVSPHKIKKGQLLQPSMPWCLKHMELYSIGNSDSALLATVDRPSERDYPRLSVSVRMIPISVLFRLKNKRKELQRLREKQSSDSPAESVVVVAR